MLLPGRLLANPRERLLVAAGALVLLGASLVSYLIKPQVVALRHAIEARDTQLQLRGSSGDMQALLSQRAEVVEQLRIRLHGSTSDLPQRETEAYIVGRLQNVSWRHGVELQSVEPMAGDDAGSFRALLFRVKLAGGYRQLYAWVSELREELGFFVVTEYRLQRSSDAAEDALLKAELTLAAYRDAGT